MRKKTILALLALLALTFTSCRKDETYAEKKEKERSAINQYIANHGIEVISESTFSAQDSTTNVDRNQYVLFENTGVYMQIVRKGTGEKLRSGETAPVLCRFTEFNIMADSVQLTNNVGYYGYLYDKMTVKNNSGTISASFVQGKSLMYVAYNSTSVPSGWLVPFRYVNIGRQDSRDEEIAKVKLIVPAAQGQPNASANVYPCHYEITYERGL